MCEKCHQFGHPKKYCHREEDYCEKYVTSLQGGKETQMILMQRRSYNRKQRKMQ